MSDPRSDPVLDVGSGELLERVEPLWLQLREHHAGATARWGEQLRGTGFASRRAGLIAKGVGGLLVVMAKSDGRDVGYCVCSIGADGAGDIDSLFVAAAHRRSGIGQKLVARGLDWFAERAVTRISVEVLVGNEAALPFYEHFGFYPRTHRLQRLNPPPTEA